MIDAKEYLQQIKLYDCHINSKLEEMQRLKNLATKITSSLKPDVVSVSCNQDKIGDAVAKIVDLEEEINQSIDRFVDHKREVRKLLEQIKDPDQLQVLQKRYLLYESLEQIACEMNMTYRNICYIHGRALQTVEKLLSGK